MFRNIHFDQKKSIVYIWETIKNQNMFDSQEWSPNVYVKDIEGKIKTIYNDKVSKKNFNHYGDYTKFCEKNQDCFENNIKSEIQFLTNRYYDIPDEEMEIPKLRVSYVDLECHSEDKTGFPHAEDADFPVVVVSIYDNIDNKTTTFGLKGYNGKYKNQEFLNYIYCSNEEQLLTKFFNYFQKKHTDVISGYNVQNFDIQYLINRSKRVFGENTDIYRRLSPISVVRTWKSNTGVLNIDIAGVTILDYMQLYKWYSPNKLENYSLDNVCKFELEKGKVDYSEYEDLRDLYLSNYDLYIEYNIIDAYRVAQLEDRLGYIKLVQTLSLLCKSPMKYFSSMTQLIEGYILTYYRRHGLCAPRFSGGHQESFDAAYVKEPHTGRYEWIIDLDIVSSYPTAIVTMNMSLETYFGRIKNLTEQEILHYIQTKQFTDFIMVTSSGEEKSFSGKTLETFNKILNKKLVCIAPCGSIFTTSKTGIIAEIIRLLFAKRVEVKERMIKLKKSIPNLRGENIIKIKEQIAQFHSHQLALKILLNAIFGITAVPYSRYFNKNIAEAIVSCGRTTRAAGEKFVNDLLNKPTDDLIKVLNMIKNDY